MIKKVGKACLGLAVMTMLTATATAGTINLNDIYNGGAPFMSDNFMWIDVDETNGPPQDPAFNFYQDPITIGDSLIVNPVNFRVDIVPGSGLDVIDSQLEMIIMGKELPGGNRATIPIIGVMEDGDYDVFGDPSAVVSAELNWFWQVLEGPSAGASGNGSVMFDANANDSGIWQLMFEDEIPQGTTKLRFEFDNRLRGFAPDNLSSAIIAKKQIPGIKVLVPEPASLALTLLGLGMVFGFVRNE